MTTLSTRQSFLKSEKAVLLRAELMAMVDSTKYNTRLIYSGTTIDTKYLFVEKYMEYMSKFPNMDHWQYLRNLKLMTKVR